jgi:hypothetical protein
MPHWRLYARDAHGWSETDITIAGDLGQALKACEAEEDERSLPVCAEPITDNLEKNDDATVPGGGREVRPALQG